MLACYFVEIEGKKYWYFKLELCAFYQHGHRHPSGTCMHMTVKGGGGGS